MFIQLYLPSISRSCCYTSTQLSPKPTKCDLFSKDLRLAWLELSWQRLLTPRETENVLTPRRVKTNTNASCEDVLWSASLNERCRVGRTDVKVSQFDVNGTWEVSLHSSRESIQGLSSPMEGAPAPQFPQRTEQPTNRQTNKDDVPGPRKK